MYDLNCTKSLCIIYTVLSSCVDLHVLSACVDLLVLSARVPSYRSVRSETGRRERQTGRRGSERPPRRRNGGTGRRGKTGTTRMRSTGSGKGRRVRRKGGNRGGKPQNVCNIRSILCMGAGDCGVCTTMCGPRLAVRSGRHTMLRKGEWEKSGVIPFA